MSEIKQYVLGNLGGMFYYSSTIICTLPFNLNHLITSIKSSRDDFYQLAKVKSRDLCLPVIAIVPLFIFIPSLKSRLWVETRQCVWENQIDHLCFLQLDSLSYGAFWYTVSDKVCYTHRLTLLTRIVQLWLRKWSGNYCVYLFLMLHTPFLSSTEKYYPYAILLFFFTYFFLLTRTHEIL